MKWRNHVRQVRFMLTHGFIWMLYTSEAGPPWHRLSHSSFLAWSSEDRGSCSWPPSRATGILNSGKRWKFAKEGGGCWVLGEDAEGWCGEIRIGIEGVRLTFELMYLREWPWHPQGKVWRQSPSNSWRFLGCPCHGNGSLSKSCSRCRHQESYLKLWEAEVFHYQHQ